MFIYNQDFTNPHSDSTITSSSSSLVDTTDTMNGAYLCSADTPRDGKEAVSRQATDLNGGMVDNSEVFKTNLLSMSIPNPKRAAMIDFLGGSLELCHASEGMFASAFGGVAPSSADMLSMSATPVLYAASTRASAPLESTTAMHYDRQRNTIDQDGKSENTTPEANVENSLVGEPAHSLALGQSLLPDLSSRRFRGDHQLPGGQESFMLQHTNVFAFPQATVAPSETLTDTTSKNLSLPGSFTRDWGTSNLEPGALFDASFGAYDFPVPPGLMKRCSTSAHFENPIISGERAATEIIRPTSTPAYLSPPGNLLVASEDTSRFLSSGSLKSNVGPVVRPGTSSVSAISGLNATDRPVGFGAAGLGTGLMLMEDSCWPKPMRYNYHPSIENSVSRSNSSMPFHNLGMDLRGLDTRSSSLQPTTPLDDGSRAGLLSLGQMVSNKPSSPTGMQAMNLNSVDERAVENVIVLNCHHILMDAAQHSLKAVELANTLRARVGTEMLALVREKWGGLLSLLERNSDRFLVERIPKNDRVSLAKLGGDNIQDGLDADHSKDLGVVGNQTEGGTYAVGGKEEDHMASRCLHVGNVPSGFTEVQLMREFEKFGQLDGLKLISQKNGHRRFAFVTYRTVAQAITARHCLSKVHPWKSAISFAHKDLAKGKGCLVGGEGRTRIDGHYQSMNGSSNSQILMHQQGMEKPAQNPRNGYFHGVSASAPMPASAGDYSNNNGLIASMGFSAPQSQPVYPQPANMIGSSALLSSQQLYDPGFLMYMNAQQSSHQPQSLQLPQQLSGRGMPRIPTASPSHAFSSNIQREQLILQRLCDDTYVPTQPWPIDYAADAAFRQAVVDQLLQFGGSTTISKLRGFLKHRMGATDNIKSVPLKAMLMAYPQIFSVDGNFVTLLNASAATYTSLAPTATAAQDSL